MIAVRFYAAALRLLPRGFRDRYGRQMLEMFEDQWRDASGLIRMRLLLRAFRDLLLTAVAVRFSDEYASAPLETPMRVGWGVGFWSDFRSSARGLTRRPLFTVTAVMTVALGIGATAAVFSVVDGTVLRGLTLRDQERTVGFWTEFEHQANNEFLVSAAELADVQNDLKSFDRVGAWMFAQGTIVSPSDGEARTTEIAQTFGDVYTMVGARAAFGRLPNRADDQPGAARVAVVTHKFWLQAFGGDESIVGRQSLPWGTSESVLVVGVLAPGAELPGTSADIWVHEVLEPADYAGNRSGHGMSVIARLREGTSIEQAQSEIAILQKQWAERYAGTHSPGIDGHSLHVARIDDRVLGTARKVAVVLSISTLLLLALACANVANLLLARGESRTAEVGVRLALGSSRLRVARPVMLEGVIISLAGGALGIFLAWVGMPLLLSVAPEDISAIDARVNARVILFALGAALLTGLIFSAAPGLNAARRDPSALLRASSRSRTGVTRGLRLLVAGQTALATLLLVGAGLLARSLHQLNTVAPGLASEGRATLDIILPVARYTQAERIIGFYESLRERVAASPGIEHAALVRHLPLRDGFRRENVIREDDFRHLQPGNAREYVVGLAIQAASPGVVRTLGMPLIAGRDLEDTDHANAVHVALINRTAAQAMWPGENAIGKRVRATFAPADHPLLTIVGVYGDVRSEGLSAEPVPELILPLAQAAPWRGWIRDLTLVIQTGGDPAAALRAARSISRELDPQVPTENFSTMVDVIRASTQRERFLTSLLGVFAALAVVIAAVGVFGVVSFTVARQKREFAIRSALGAKRLAILGGVLRANTIFAGAGAVVGIGVATLAAPAMSEFLYQVAPRDLVVMIAVPCCLIAIALVSAMAPALRATRVAPAHLLQDGD